MKFKYCGDNNAQVSFNVDYFVSSFLMADSFGGISVRFLGQGLCSGGVSLGFRGSAVS